MALTLLMDVPASALHSGINIRHVNMTEIRRLIPGMALGAMAGIGLTAWLEARWPLMLLGCYVAAVGINALRAATRKPQTVPGHWIHGAGFAIG